MRPLQSPGQALGMVLDAIGKPRHKRLVMLVQYALTSQEHTHAVGMANGHQRSSKQHAVEARQHARDAALVPLKKTLHDFDPDGVWQYHLG